MAGYLVEKCGVREPWHAEVVLTFTARRSDGELADEFDGPVARPPDDLGQ